MSFVWLDVETTGLDPAKDLILEVGIIVTDDHFREQARNHWVVRQDLTKVQELMDECVRHMHIKSGLLTELWDERLLSNDGICNQICHWLIPLVGGPDLPMSERPVLSGNSIGFDRAMLAVHMPRVLDFVHYRNLDVSSFKVLCCALDPSAKAWNDNQPKPPHRALADLDGSIAELHHWRKVLKEMPL